MSKEEDISEKMVTQTRELINAPYDLDAEVMDAQVSGKHVILTWMPSDGADGYKIYQQEEGAEEPEELGTSTTERFEFDIESEGEYNYTVKAYKGSQESESSNALTVICGNQPVSANKTLQKNCVYGDNLTVSGGILDLNGKMLKVYGNILQTNESQIDLNNGKLIAMTDYTIDDESELIMDDSNDYVYVNGQFFFYTSIEHGNGLMNDGLIQVVGDDFKIMSEGNFQPGGNHKVYLNGIDLESNTTIGFGNDYTSKFNILGINKPLSKYNFIPSGREVSSFFNQLIILENDKPYYGIDGVHTPTGNFSRSYTDMTLPAPGLDIIIGRVYNSRNEKEGILGKGWTFSYEGSVIASGEFAEVYMPDGQVQNYLEVDPNQTSPKVYKGMNSRSELVYYQNTDSYELEFKDKTKYGFEKIGNEYLLSYIEDCYGNEITITHLSNGKVDTIKDKNNRTIQISYPNTTTVNVTDSVSSRTVSYSLNNDNILETVTDANGNESYKYTYGSTSERLEKVEATVKLKTVHL